MSNEVVVLLAIGLWLGFEVFVWGVSRLIYWFAQLIKKCI